MNTELINEFYLLQISRSNKKYIDMLDEQVYGPIVKVNAHMSNWVDKRGQMLIQLESRMNRTFRRLKHRYLKF